MPPHGPLHTRFLVPRNDTLAPRSQESAETIEQMAETKTSASSGAGAVHRFGQIYGFVIRDTDTSGIAGVVRP